ncbi:hypothetical protein [Glycomyces tarimensis]
MTELVVTDRSRIARMLTPWFAGGAGGPGSEFDLGSTPMTIGQAVRSPTSWNNGVAARVGYFRHRFAEQHGPVMLLIPAYAVDHHVLLLDGVHRIIAAMMSEVELRLIAYVLDGPADGAVSLCAARWADVLLDRPAAEDRMHLFPGWGSLA